MNFQQQVENAARAFYLVDNDGRSWEDAPEALKEEFRSLAREAIALLPEFRREQGIAA